ncbi:MAG: hypothetical protein Q8865_04235 [Bacillota bacterium]|nr:hypothetical protein [Bacillota bacterium]
MLFDKLTDARKRQADEEQAYVAVCRYSRAPVGEVSKSAPVRGRLNHFAFTNRNEDCV